MQSHSGSEKLVAPYARVSTEQQVDRDSLANQKEVLLRYAKNTGKHYRLYEDAGHSAKDTNRPAFSRLMGDVNSGCIEAVVVTKLDRISRSMKDLLQLFEELESNQVEFVSLTQDFDTSNPTGRFHFNLMGSLSQWEREMTAERVRESMLVRAQRGLWNGGPAPFGFKHEPTAKTLVPCGEEVQIVQRIFDLYLELGSFRGVAHELNSLGLRTRKGCHWTSTSVKRILTNPVYYGAIPYNRRKAKGRTSVPRPESEHIVFEDAFAPIVSKELFQLVQARISSSRRVPPATKGSPYLLSGQVRCGECGSRMYGYTQARRDKTYRYYRCNGHASKGGSFCPGMAIDTKMLDEIIVSELNLFKTRPDRIAGKLYGQQFGDGKKLTAELKGVENTISRIAGKRNRLLELYEDGLIEKAQFSARSKVLTEEQENLSKRAELIRAELSKGKQIDLQATLQSLGSLSDVLEGLDSTQQRRDLLRAMIGDICVGKSTIKYSVYGLPTELLDWERTGRGS